MTRQHSIYYIAALPMLLLLLVVVVALAGTATIPHSFVPGEVANANQVNENFTAVKAAIDDNDSRLMAAESPTRPGTMLAHCSLGTNGVHSNPWTSTGANIITSRRATGDFLFEVEGVTLDQATHMVIANVVSTMVSTAAPDFT